MNATHAHLHHVIIAHILQWPMSKLTSSWNRVGWANGGHIVHPVSNHMSKHLPCVVGAPFNSNPSFSSSSESRHSPSLASLVTMWTLYSTVGCHVHVACNWLVTLRLSTIVPPLSVLGGSGHVVVGLSCCFCTTPRCFVARDLILHCMDTPTSLHQRCALYV